MINLFSFGKNNTQEFSSALSWDEFRECLTNPILRPEVEWKVSKLPKTIDIGKLGVIANDMLKETSDDPLHRERGTYVKVDVYDKLKAKKAEFAEIGSEFEVTINQNLENYSIFSYADTSEKVAAIIHTHPKTRFDAINQLPSFLDISNLLSEEPNSASISIIFTEGNKNVLSTNHWLLIKTLETSKFDFDSLDKWVADNDSLFWALFYDTGNNFELLEKFMIEKMKGENIAVYKSISNLIFKLL